MKLDSRTEDRVTIVDVEGSVDALTATEVTNYLDALAKAGKINLVINLEKVEYVSSAGLRTLLAILKSVRAEKGDVRLAAVQPNVKKVLAMSGFTSIMQVFETVTQAVGSFA